jgi:hypothetical protein
MVGRPASSTHSSSRQKEALLNPGRLAAALGLSSFITKLQAPALAVPALARQGSSRVPKLGVASARWHSASSSQHVRNMLQVCWLTRCADAVLLCTLIGVL